MVLNVTRMTFTDIDCACPNPTVAPFPALIERNDQRLKAGIHLQKIKKQEWDGVEEGEVWVKFVYMAPERGGGGGEWED